jgi:hypothetical protein
MTIAASSSSFSTRVQPVPQSVERAPLGNIAIGVGFLFGIECALFGVWCVAWWFIWGALPS